MTAKLYLWAIILVATLSAGACLADTIAVGSRVQFERAGQTFEGKVVAVRGNGALYEIETNADGQLRRIVVASKFVREMPATTADQWRTWSDQTGRFQIEAKLQSQSAFEVTLQKRDGTLVKVPLDKLSIADQEYVATLDPGAENPFESGAVGNAGGAMAGSGNPASSGAAGSGLNLPEPIVLRTASSMEAQPSGPPTELVPDPSRLDFSKLGTAGMTIPKPEGETGRPLFISETGTKLCYQVRSGRAFGRDPVAPFTQIYLIDGEARRTRQVGEIQGASIWLCSGDPETGNVLGAVMKTGDEKARSLCVIAGIADGRPNIIAHWRMYPNNDDAADYVRYRKILSNGMAIVYFDGKIQAYDFEQGVHAWTQPSGAFNEPAISAGGRYAACMTDRAIVIRETKSGQQLGAIPCSFIGPVAMGFSPDGERLAVASGNQVVVYNAQSGEELYQHEANTELGAMGKQVFWLEPNLLLLPTGAVLDMERDLLIWKYNLLNDGIDYTDVEHQGLIAFHQGDQMTIVRLPHERAKEASANPPQNIIALRPGDTVSVQVNSGGMGNPNEIGQAVEQALSSAGFKTASNAANQAVASIARGTPKTEEYRILGRGFGTEEVTYTPITSRVEIRQNGKVIWQRGTTSGLPFFLQGNETLQDAAKNAEKPNIGFFSGLKLPKQILKPEYQQGFGTSNVSAAGIKDL